MPSKLRPLYDKLYMGIDTFIVAINENKSGKQRAKSIEKIEDFDAQYKDIVLPYWKKYGVKPKKYWVRVYSQNQEKLDPRYIPNDIWVNKIIPHFNNLLFSQAYQDKCLNNVFVPDINHPGTIVKNVNGVFYDDELNLLSKEEAIKRCLEANRVVIKPSVGSGRGNGIEFFNGYDLKVEDAEKLFSNYKMNYIVQEKAKQHEVLNSLCSESLNTIRIVTFLYENEVRILSVILRFGAGDSELDNVSKGGYAIKVNLDGRLDKYAVNRKAEWISSLPNGIVFEDVVIPNFERIINTVKKASEKLGHFKILGWDISVDENAEPIFVEYNVIPDQNQKTWGPTFGDMTERILEEVFNK